VYPDDGLFGLMGKIRNLEFNKSVMQDITRDLFVSLAAFAAIFGIIYVFVITRHREHMSMLEKGVDPSVFRSKGKSGAMTLKFGMLCVGISLGILLGYIFYRNDVLDRSVAYLSMTFLSGGISLILNFLIDQKLKD